jgi:ribosome maturation factor RimP
MSPTVILDEEVVVMASTDRIRALAAPLLAAAGLELWDVEAGRDVVRVMVDRPGGVDLDAIADASRVVSELLDEHEELVPAGQYQLEVSSPGLERTLRTPEQYRRYVGSTVAVKTTAAVDGDRRHRGVLVDAGDDGIDLLRDDAPSGSPLTIPYDRIERSRTVIDWGPAPKPGSRPKTARKRSESADQAGADAPADATTGAAQDPKDRAR